VSSRSRLWRFVLPPSLPTPSLVDSTRALRDALLHNLQAATRSTALRSSADVDANADVDVDVDVVVSRDYDALRLAMLTGAADAALSPPAVCAQLAPLLPVPLMCVRRGQTRFASALVMRTDDDRDLLYRSPGARPLRAAWVDPSSACGHLLPRAYLRQQARLQQRADVGVTDVGFFGSYALALDAVRDGRADVAGVHALEGGAGSDEAIDAHLGEGAHADFRVVAVSASAPGDGVAAVPGAGVLVDAVKALPVGVLRRFFRVEGFVEAQAGAWSSLV